ncbi:ABC transporter substrate-binding protein [Vibrio gazogenes]|uniref:Peptide ABC transporter n=1 Tax=Vibrio gazogenes TaxID=687 RepID=A0A1Z2SI60_VIBGA|nr:ABC transporter substrate-binding protein [Vibrio gazogenes]ASA56869.1 peptide ABC transporter [Vibrio gazogenes]
MKTTMVAALTAAVLTSGTAFAESYDDLTATMNVIQVVGSIDPAKVSDYTEYMMAVNLYDGLTTADTTGKIVPHLAKSWDISPNGKTFTFHLDENAKFQDGSPLEAKDVVYSTKRMLTLNQGPAGFFQPYLDADGVKATDAHTVTFTLKQPSSAFLAMTPILFIINSDVAREHAGKNKWAEEYLASNTAGTGAYELGEWQRGSRIILERNHDYFKGFTGHPLERVRILITNDESTIKALANKGELDLSSTYQANETLSAIDKLKNYHIQQLSTASGYYVKFNNQLAPTDDVNIRKAIALAIDYDLINEDLHPGEPMAGPLASLFKDSHLDSLEPPKLDLAKAAEYVKKSKYAGRPIPITLGYVAGSAYEEEIALMMQANLQTIGFKPTLQADPWSRITEIAAKPETTPNVNQIFFGPTYSSPLSVFYNQYSSKSAGSWASMSWLNDPKVDDMIDAAGTTLNDDKRNAIYQDLQKYIVDNQVDTFLQTTYYRMAVNNCLSDMKFIPIQSFYYDFSHFNWLCRPAGR